MPGTLEIQTCLSKSHVVDVIPHASLASCVGHRGEQGSIQVEMEAILHLPIQEWPWASNQRVLSPSCLSPLFVSSGVGSCET